MTGKELKQLRLQKGITQQELASRSDVPLGTIGRIESKEDEHVKKIETLEKLLSVLNTVTNARFIGNVDAEYGEDSEGNTKFREISPGRYMMRIEFVPERARAGFLLGFRDAEHHEELPMHSVTVDYYAKGKYLAFEVEGDSMDDGSKYSIPNKAIVTARFLPQDRWFPKLHVHNYPDWVFVHKYEGILVKQIADQDFEKGIITLRSLNPDKVTYPDTTYELKDIQAIYNVIKRELPY
jgi:transcriptional regulator with XRE-family HTH domain